MFRFLIVSFCFLSGIAYISQKNAGYDTGFSTLANLASTPYDTSGFGDIDPDYVQTSGRHGLPTGLKASEFPLVSLPVKKPPFTIALPVMRPDPNSIQTATAKNLNKRLTLSSIRNTKVGTYHPENFNVPSLQPEHMSPGKLLKKHRMEIAGNTVAIFRDDHQDKTEQYSRDSKVRIKSLFKKKIKRHPYGYRRRYLSPYSYVVRKRRRSTAKRGFIKKGVVKAKRHTEKRTRSARVRSRKKK